MKINKYFPVTFVYFFLNSVGLPASLLYTTLLTPLFYLWLVVRRQRYVLAKFVLPLLPFALVQLGNGVDEFFYAKSAVYYFTVYIFTYACYVLAKSYQGWPALFEKLTRYNFAFTLLAIVLFVTPYQELVWYVTTVSEGITRFPRLAMLTYEASYYSTLLVPLFAFYFLRLLLGKVTQQNVLLTLMLAFSLVLSFSMGVLAGLALSFAILILFHLRKFLSRKSVLYPFLSLLLLGGLGLILLFVVYPENPLTVRIYNVLEGTDSSGRGRTFEAFELAYLVAESKSVWWGVGPGQVKVAGDYIIRSFYGMTPAGELSVTIPCAFAETLAIFGLIGAAVRFLATWYLFFRTRVYHNYFRLFLFIYIFIYQFTGSFITNVAEYVIWVFAFVNVFPEFDKSPAAGSQPVRDNLRQQEVLA